MKRFLIFLAGGIVGFFGSKVLQMENVVEPVEVIASSLECNEPMTELHVSNEDKAPAVNSSMTTASPQADERKPAQHPTIAKDEEQMKSKRKVLITFSEELLMAIEDEWNDLPNQARLSEEDRGWRVIYLEPNSTFSKIGLVIGDLIPRETIQNLNLRSRAPDNLQERVIHILDQVTY